MNIPPYDPNKPTAAVVLADSTTEDFDFLIPYTLLSMTDAYNVYAVAPDTNVKTISGGLDVIPHYSYQELDHLLQKNPDIIVVPYMPTINAPSYKPTREWIQKYSGSPFADILGCIRDEKNTIITDAFGKTSVRGVYAAGDTAAAAPSQLVIAAAIGSRAAIGVNEDLSEETFYRSNWIELIL
ncbi:hypothetical protein U9M73_21955 [Paenibacillus phoenicis]|uniref:FAD/NAD(P)-binding domain-containing protein n=1 Tax=Paenibacillus phoenicis TaxID=554117 RepID=A0ABU5PS30_9BACL|nr:hypothetical protein [Paenibacillus phoenicis]MEA3572597.1 hypothetical protein [Paenibacillus phoenicis]